VQYVYLLTFNYLAGSLPLHPTYSQAISSYFFNFPLRDINNNVQSLLHINVKLISRQIDPRSSIPTYFGVGFTRSLDQQVTMVTHPHYASFLIRPSHYINGCHSID